MAFDWRHHAGKFFVRYGNGGFCGVSFFFVQRALYGNAICFVVFVDEFGTRCFCRHKRHVGGSCFLAGVFCYRGDVQPAGNMGRAVVVEKAEIIICLSNEEK